MVEVSGYKLKQSIQLLEMHKSALETEFEDSLYFFKDEKKRKPDEISQDIAKAEESIACLQAAQALFNINTRVNVAGQEMTLCQAIKMVGGAGRTEKRWKTQAKGCQSPTFRQQQKDLTQEYATPALTQREALTNAKKAALFASQLRAAVAEANSTKMKISDLDEKLVQR